MSRSRAMLFTIRKRPLERVRSFFRNVCRRIETLPEEVHRTRCHKSVRCATCRKKRATEIYEAADDARCRTRYCIGCAKVHHKVWYDAYTMATRCIKCKRRGRATEIYNAIKTSYCIGCAKELHGEWYAAYVQATRCAHCENQKAHKIYESFKTECCIACAVTHDKDWHAAYLRSTQCAHCENRKAHKIYANIKTLCCIACAIIHDSAWHTAYLRATRCAHCESQKSHKVYENIRTRCCIACAKIHDKEWYAAWHRYHECKGTNCDNFRNPNLEGFCGRCFAHTYPLDRRAHFIKYKEKAVMQFLSSKFPGNEWQFDKPIPGGNSKRRPDAYMKWDTHALTIEIDEREHGGYDCECERRKMMEHFQDSGSIPHWFIRFNPDAFTDPCTGKREPSCWGTTPKTREPRVTRFKAWGVRLDKLAQIVTEAITNPPAMEVHLVPLFYSS